MLEQGAIVLAKGGKGPAGDRPEGNFTRKPSRVRHQAGTVADMRGVGDVLEPPKLIRCSRSLACPSKTSVVTCACVARARAHTSVLPGTGRAEMRQHLHPHSTRDGKSGRLESLDSDPCHTCLTDRRSVPERQLDK